MMNAKEQIEKNTTEYDEARLEEALDILMQMRAVDKTKGYRRIMASVNRGTCRRRFILWSRYAAIVVVIVVVGVIWGVRGRVDRVVPVMQVQEIVPGHVDIGNCKYLGGWRHDPEKRGSSDLREREKGGGSSDGSDV